MIDYNDGVVVNIDNSRASIVINMEYLGFVRCGAPEEETAFDLRALVEESHAVLPERGGTET